MKSLFLRVCALGSLLGLAVVTPAARADIIFSNFSPANGSGFSAPLPYVVAGTGQGYQSLAAAFTPTQNYSLSAFQVAVGHLGGTNSFRFSLVGDNGGRPTGAPVVAPFTSAITGVGTINSFGVSGTLLAGNAYWLVMEPGANDTKGGWYQNSIGQVGGFNYANTPGNWLASSFSTPVFRIEGVAIPEPGSLAFLTLGAGAFLIVRRRRTA